MKIKNRILYGCISLILLLSVSATVPGFTGGAITGIIIKETGVETPEWNVGDEWVMGFEETITDEELMSKLTPSERAVLDYVTLDADISLGVYESLRVMESGVMIGDYETYRTYFEAYYGAVGSLDLYANLDENDYQAIFDSIFDDEEMYYDSEYEDEFYYEESDIFEDIQIDLMYDISGYLWMECDLTGDVYFTEDKLAVVKEVMTYKINADINYDMDMKTTMTEGSFTEKMDMSAKTQIQYEDVTVDFIIEYDPPLELFEYPFDEYDYWYTDSSVKFTVTDASGTIYYDISLSSSIDFMDSIKENGEIVLSKDDFTDTTESYNIEISGESSGTEQVVMPDGSVTDCYEIELEKDKSYGYNGYYPETGYYEKPESSYTSIDGSSDFDEDEFLDAGSYSDMGYVSTITSGNLYYSEDESYVVQEQMTDLDFVNIGDSDIESSTASSFLGPGLFSGDGMVNEDVADTTLKPREYRQLESFRDDSRSEMKSEYESIKKNQETSNPASKMDNLVLYSVVSVIVLLVLVIICASILIKRKKARKAREQSAAVSPQTQPGAVPAVYHGTQMHYPQPVPAPAPQPQPQPYYQQQPQPQPYYHHQPQQPQTQNYYNQPYQGNVQPQHQQPVYQQYPQSPQYPPNYQQPPRQYY